MSRCFFREFAPAGLRECDGKVQRHHMIRQQVIKRMLAPGRSHLMLDDELRDAKANLNRALNDPRNLLDVCKRHHDLWHVARICVSRGDVPDELEDFATDHGLEWELDRMFGLREDAA